MARGDSGRIVLEIDPSQKGELYSVLTKNGLTLKDWFLQQASQYLQDRSQLSLFGSSVAVEKPASYRVKSKPVSVSPVKKKQHSGKTKVR
jgi:hypothetical protein